jgi:protein-tyrosine phosphatase
MGDYFCARVIYFMKIHVLFVCLGNICRSPMAEAVFQNLVNQAGLSDQITVDSVGTGPWHIGEKAHAGTRQILKQHGIPYHGRARQVSQTDIQKPNSIIIAMDHNNIRDIQQRYGRETQISLLLDYAQQTNERAVPDPYYSGNFEYAYQLVLDGCQGLLETIRQENGL